MFGWLVVISVSRKGTERTIWIRENNNRLLSWSFCFLCVEKANSWTGKKKETPYLNGVLKKKNLFAFQVTMVICAKKFRLQQNSDVVLDCKKIYRRGSVAQGDLFPAKKISFLVHPDHFRSDKKVHPDYLRSDKRNFSLTRLGAQQKNLLLV